MSGKFFRALAPALCVAAAAPLWASAAQAGPPGSPGYCPGDGLLHDWDTGRAIGSCPIGGGLVTTPNGNVWIDRNGTAHQAPTPQGQGSGFGPGAQPYSSENDDRSNPRPVPVRPGGQPPLPQGHAGAIGGGP